MEGQGGGIKPSPLRNSRAVNRPFQSPLRTVHSPRGTINSDRKELKISNVESSFENLATPEKRISIQPRFLAKKICTQNQQMQSNDGRSIHRADLDKMKDRIRRKKQQIEHIKHQLIYKKKHNFRELNDLTATWLQGCQGALTQFQKDICRNSENTISMANILSQLRIPPELVQYSVEDCNFV